MNAAALDITNPAPGIYESVSFEDYCRIPAVNRSRLDWIHEFSPLHCHYHARQPEDEESCLIVGRATHAVVLAPQRVADFKIAQQCQATTGKGGRCSRNGSAVYSERWYCTQHAPILDRPDPVSVLDQEEWDTVEDMAAAITANVPANAFLTGEGPNELTLVWRDRPTGLLCKAQVDMTRPGWHALGDLKTTARSAREFARTMADYGLHRQGAFYLDGALELGLADVHKFAFIVVEKEPPHGVATYELGEASLSLGREQNRRLLETYAKCQAADQWPGYDEPFPVVDVPKFEFQKELTK